VNHTALMEPIVAPKYNIAYVVDHCPIELIKLLEPWCDRLYVDGKVDVVTNSILNHVYEYREKEQQNTLFDLSKRVMLLKENDPHSENDIIVEFDATRLTQQNFQLLQQLPSIIKESGEIGRFELDIFTIEINHLEEHTKNLIKLNSL